MAKQKQAYFFSKNAWLQLFFPLQGGIIDSKIFRIDQLPKAVIECSKFNQWT